jgi:hypothetical protein
MPYDALRMTPVFQEANRLDSNSTTSLYTLPGDAFIPWSMLKLIIDKKNDGCMVNGSEYDASRDVYVFDSRDDMYKALIDITDCALRYIEDEGINGQIDPIVMGRLARFYRFTIYAVDTIDRINGEK